MKNGGPAFPVSFTTGNTEKGFTNHVSPGMSMRDWLAGQSLDWVLKCRLDKEAFMYEGWERYAASEAYRIADAMLAEREREAQDD